MDLIGRPWYFQSRRKQNNIGEDDINFGPFMAILDLFEAAGRARAPQGLATEGGPGVPPPENF